MIASLKGKVTDIRNDSIILEVCGVGYLVFLSHSILSTLKHNQDLYLLIETVTKENGTTLYGFSEKGEKDVFELLITVQGIGPKIAITALSTFSYFQIVNHIMLANSKALQQVSGIGTKAAIRIVNELKDKVAKLGFNIKEASEKVASSFLLEDDLLATLISLGYKEGEAKKAISSIAENDYSQNDLQKAVKDALKYFTNENK